MENDEERPVLYYPSRVIADGYYVDLYWNPRAVKITPPDDSGENNEDE